MRNKKKKILFISEYKIRGDIKIDELEGNDLASVKESSALSPRFSNLNIYHLAIIDIFTHFGSNEAILTDVTF